MKKIIICAILALTLLCVLASCDIGNDNPSLIGTTTPDTTTTAIPVDTTTPADHVHSYAATVVDPTCIADGYTLYVCDCGDQYIDNVTPKSYHSFTAWNITKQPTCTEEGVQSHNCTICGTVETQKLAKLEHKYIDTVVPPTKTTPGYTSHICAYCRASFNDTYTNATGSLGLEYADGVGGTKMIVGIGQCRDTDIIIYSTDSDGKTVSAIDARAFMGASTVKTVSIPASIVNIGDGAFAGCTNLSTITVENDNKYFKSVDNVLYSKDGTVIVAVPGSYKVPDGIFQIPETVTEIRPGAFAGCVNIKGFKVPEASSLRFFVEDGVLFSRTGESSTMLVAYPCGKTGTEFTIPEINQIGSLAFYNSKLTTIDFAGLVAKINPYAFAECDMLTSLSLPSTVTELGVGVFANCDKLTSVTLSENIKVISGYCFSGCRALGSFTVRDNITGIGECAFKNCTSLESIIIGSGVNKIDKDILLGASLKAVYLKKDYNGYRAMDIDTSNVTPMTLLAKLYFYTDSETKPAGVLAYWTIKDGVILTTDDETWDIKKD